MYRSVKTCLKKPQTINPKPSSLLIHHCSSLVLQKVTTLLPVRTWDRLRAYVTGLCWETELPNGLRIPYRKYLLGINLSCYLRKHPHSETKFLVHVLRVCDLPKLSEISSISPFQRHNVSVGVLATLTKLTATLREKQ